MVATVGQSVQSVANFNNKANCQINFICHESRMTVVK